MDEREKIIGIIQSAKYCDTNNRCEECKYDKESENNEDMSCGSLRVADALIAAGIGDVKETERRAEVAKRALLMACVILIKDEEDNVNMELLARVVYTMFLRKAEKELAGEKNEQV